GRLNPTDTSSLASNIAGRELEVQQQTALYRQSEGNPLFIVELVRAAIVRWAAGDMQEKALLEMVAGPFGFSTNIALPDRVQAVIETRLAQLTPLAHEVIQLAAVIGRSFALEVMVQSDAFNEDQVIHALDELWQRNLLVEQGVKGYDFSHPLIREVAYRLI